MPTARAHHEDGIRGHAGSLGNWRNEGDRIVYEWRGKVLDRRRPVELDEGDLIGFDVVAIDNDGNGNAAWVPWGPAVSGKKMDNNRVGRLLLGPSDLSAADAAVLVSILEAWNDGHSGHNVHLHNLEGLEGLEGLGGLEALQKLKHLENLEHFEDLGAEIGQLVEQLVEHQGELSGQQAAIAAAHMAGEIAAVASRAGAIATAEARMAGVEARMAAADQIGAPPPPMAPTPVGLYMEQRGSPGYEVMHTIAKFCGGCAIILAIGFTAYLIRRGGRQPAPDPEAAEAMDERISRIESRMTDTQDVMIALSEKLDRIDDGGRKGDEA